MLPLSTSTLRYIHQKKLQSSLWKSYTMRNNAHSISSKSMYVGVVTVDWFTRLAPWEEALTRCQLLESECVTSTKFKAIPLTQTYRQRDRETQPNKSNEGFTLGFPARKYTRRLSFPTEKHAQNLRKHINPTKSTLHCYDLFMLWYGVITWHTYMWFTIIIIIIMYS